MAVEFALAFPFMIALYFGLVVAVQAIVTSHRVTEVTYALANVVSQEPATDQARSSPLPTTAISQSTLDVIVTAARMLMPQQPNAVLAVTISAVDINNKPGGACCLATVRWSYTSGGALRPCGTLLTGIDQGNPGPSQFPAALLPGGTTLPHPIYYIVIDVAYNYRPLLKVVSSNLKGFQTLRPRHAGQVIAGPLSSTGTSHGTVCY